MLAGPLRSEWESRVPVARVSPGWLWDGSRRREAISETGDEYARRRLLPTTSNLRVVESVQHLRSITAGAGVCLHVPFIFVVCIYSFWPVFFSPALASWVIP